MLKIMSFEEYLEQHPELYSGTECDEATQGALLEWLFDYPISDESKFARYYRRRLNLLYPIYLKQVRLCSVLNNWDPFIVQYMEQLGSTGKTSDGKTTTNKTTAGTTGTTNTTSRIIDATRTPELDYTTERDLAHTEISTGTNGETASSTTQAADETTTQEATESHKTDDLEKGAWQKVESESDNETREQTTRPKETTQNSGSDYLHTSTERVTEPQGSETHTTEYDGRQTDADSKSLQYNMAYPEEFSSALIMDADSYSEATIPTGAAASGAYNNTKQTQAEKGKTIQTDRFESGRQDKVTERTLGTKDDNSTEYGRKVETSYDAPEVKEKTRDHTEGVEETTTGGHDVTTIDEHSEHGSTVKGQHGETVTSETTGNSENKTNGTDTGTETRTERGHETTRTSETTTGKTDGTNSTTENGETVNTGKEVIINKNIQQGRNESPADILPRATMALQTSQPLKWLVDNLLVCFDTYDII